MGRLTVHVWGHPIRLHGLAFDQHPDWEEEARLFVGPMGTELLGRGGGSYEKYNSPKAVSVGNRDCSMTCRASAPTGSGQTRSCDSPAMNIDICCDVPCPTLTRGVCRQPFGTRTVTFVFDLSPPKQKHVGDGTAELSAS